MLTIQNQTCAGKIFNCTIFVGYGGVIFFYWCRTICYKYKIYLLYADLKNADKRGETNLPIPLEAFNNLEYNIEKASFRHRLLIKTIVIFNPVHILTARGLMPSRKKDSYVLY